MPAMPSAGAGQEHAAPQGERCRRRATAREADRLDGQRIWAVRLPPYYGPSAVRRLVGEPQAGGADLATGVPTPPRDALFDRRSHTARPTSPWSNRLPQSRFNPTPALHFSTAQRCTFQPAFTYPVVRCASQSWSPSARAAQSGERATEKNGPTVRLASKCPPLQILIQVL